MKKYFIKMYFFLDKIKKDIKSISITQNRKDKQ